MDIRNPFRKKQTNHAANYDRCAEKIQKSFAQDLSSGEVSHLQATLALVHTAVQCWADAYKAMDLEAHPRNIRVDLFNMVDSCITSGEVDLTNVLEFPLRQQTK